MAKIKTEDKLTYIYDLETFTNFFSASFKEVKTKERKQFILFADPRDTKLSINQIAPLIWFLENEVKTLVGYNNHEFDDIILKHLLLGKGMFEKLTKVEEIVQSTKVLSDKLIAQQRGVGYHQDKYIKGLKGIKKFGSIDLMALFNTIDRASLKQVAVNLKWPNIIDLPYDPDTLIVREAIPEIMLYNDNDVDITEALLNFKRKDLQFRRELSLAYDINVLNSNDTNIAKAVIRKFYSEETGRRYDDFRDQRTHMKKIHLKNCVSPKIRFASKPYNLIINDIRSRVVSAEKAVKAMTYIKKNDIAAYEKHKEEAEKDGFKRIVHTKYLTHTIGLGGIHSNNPSEELIETELYEYIDVDAVSFYPWIIINDKLFPKHLGPEFYKVYREKIVRLRIKAKRDAEAGVDVEMNTLIAEALKLTANSTFGLTKSKHSWMYDPQVATYICISGQLYLLMLIERIEMLTDCVVVYSNTDGITTRVPKGSKEAFIRICEQWQEYTGFDLEFTNYRRMVLKDINNYLIITSDDKKPVKEKGMFLTKKKITSGYNFPIVAKALREYYLNDIPFEVTIKKETDIFMFVRAQRTSIKKFKLFLINATSETELNKTNRWIATKGNPKEGRLMKFHNILKDKAGQPRTANVQKESFVTVVNDIPDGAKVPEFNINYGFYINECIKVQKSIKRYTDGGHNTRLTQGVLL